jgi:DnaJ-domain-containing protein 1
MEPERVTRNLDALLLENQALRQEVAALREELRRVRARGRLDGVTGAGPRVTTGMAPGITAEQVREWLELLARQPGWSRLRVEALKALLAAQRGAEARGDLEDELDRRSPGLGTDLRRALRGHTGKGKHVLRAAFARYGVRAPEWLNADPRRVIDDLLADLDDLETRQQRAQQSRAQQNHEREPPPPRRAWGSDPRAEALRILGLSPGASLREVKAAHRRLVKRHHPDAGGEVDAFRRIDAAYLQLIS